MKILSFFPVHRSIPGLTYSGGERRFIEISKVWSALGNDVHIVTTSYAQRLLQEFDYHTTTYIYEPARFKGMGINVFMNVRRMLAKIPDEKFDIIYTPGEPFTYVIASSMAKRELKIPIAASFNLFNPDKTSAIHYILQVFKKSGYNRSKYAFVKGLPREILLALASYVRNFYSRNLDLIFSVGSQVKNLLITIGVSPERIFVVSAGIDFDRIQKVGRVEKVYDACFMGSIIPRKGVADLIESWRMVVKEKQDARLVIMGKGSLQYEAVIRHLIEKFGLQDNVSMLGFVVGDEKYRIMKGSRIFVFPSYLETFGQAICEAMACELPVVAYDLPVYDEWYGDTLLRVNSGDTKGLKLGILSLLEDEKLRDRMGYEGREVARQYRWENVAKYQHEIITQRLLSCCILPTK